MWSSSLPQEHSREHSPLVGPLRLGHLRRDGALKATPLTDPSSVSGVGGGVLPGQFLTSKSSVHLAEVVTPKPSGPVYVGNATHSGTHSRTRGQFRGLLMSMNFTYPSPELPLLDCRCLVGTGAADEG